MVTENFTNNIVSIIMPCFNAEKYISEAINSVRAQSYQNWELLICDDNSTDDSARIIKNFEAMDPRILLIPNVYAKGAAGARNSSLRSAKGRYIAFLDADDTWEYDKLQSQLLFMQTYNYKFTFTYYRATDETGVPKISYQAPKSVSIHHMRTANYIPCLTVIYDAEFYGKVMQPVIRRRNDYALWLTMLLKVPNERAHCLPRIGGSYRTNNYGLSSSRLLALRDHFRCLKNFGGASTLSAVAYSMIFLFIVFIKKKFPRLYNNVVTKI